MSFFDIMKFIIVIILIFALLTIIKKYNTFVKVKRVSYYSLDALNSKSLSFSDKLLKKIYNFIISFRKLFGKSEILLKYGKKYYKYISYDKRNYIKGIDFITTKFIMSILFLILTLISSIYMSRIPSIFEVIINLIIGFWLFDLYLYFYTKRFNKIISNQLLRAVIVMNNSFKSGKSTLQTLKIASEELPSPINDEFTKMYLDMKFGLSVDCVFERFSKRVKIPEAVYISSSLKILNSTGGNIVDVFSSIEKTLFDNKKLKEELNNISGAPKMIVMVLMIVPILFTFLIYILNPNYFDSLFNTTLGNFLLFVILIMFSIYLFLLRKIMKVGV